MVITTFDPWQSSMCTCPPKYSFNPYTGCGHGCIYCYSTYIPRFHEERPKTNVLRQFEKGVMKLQAGALLSIANSSDPYTPLENKMRITRICLEKLLNYNLRVLLITKGAIVTRDIDILKRLRVAVTISITTIDPQKAKKLEPGAPSPAERLSAVRDLSRHGIPVGVRFDPILPGLTEEDIPDIVGEIARAGATHVTSSTFKPRMDGWHRFVRAFPAIAKGLACYDWERLRGSYYLPHHTRYALMEKVSIACQGEGLTFTSCREGFGEQTESCDGSHLIPYV